MEPREEGGKVVYPCGNCNGYGSVVVDDPWYEQRCDECDGTGEYVDG